MIRYIRDLRLIPIALIASACLFVLKTADLVLHSSYFPASGAAPADEDVSLARPAPDALQAPGGTLSWAQQMFNFPNGSGVAPEPAGLPAIAPRLAERENNADITGSVTESAAGAGNAAKTTPASGKDGKPSPPAGLIPTQAAMPTGAERAILERLQERREELDTRARELDIRESLIEGAEKRMEAKLTELKDIEARIKVETDQKDDAEAARFKSLIIMYETMKPRDAAKIFDRLDIGVLVEVAAKINPRQMAEILAQMSPDTAQRLTVELASRAQQSKPGGVADLPKIEGQPAPQ